MRRSRSHTSAAASTCRGPISTIRAVARSGRRFDVGEVPTLVLVKGKRVVDRIEGRASAPRIETMIEPHLAAAAA